MSRFASILLTVLYAVTLLQAYMPHVNYWINRNYIISELCENRDRPEMDCNGRCHLKKQIETSSEQQERGSAITEVQLMVEFVQPLFVLEIKPIIDQANVKYGNHTVEPVVGFSPSIFHPPQI